MHQYWTIQSDDSFRWRDIASFFEKELTEVEDTEDFVRSAELRVLAAKLGMHLCSVTAPKNQI